MRVAFFVDGWESVAVMIRPSPGGLWQVPARRSDRRVGTLRARTHKRERCAKRSGGLLPPSPAEHAERRKHQAGQARADDETGDGENSVRALVAVLLLVGIGAAVAAYHGMFYVTGSQFHEACSQRQAKEKIDGGFKEVGADNPSQAALWSSCTPIMGESMANAGFAIGSSSPQATEDAKALASVRSSRI
jgi:hypothetical protein